MKFRGIIAWRSERMEAHYKSSRSSTTGISVATDLQRADSQRQSRSTHQISNIFRPRSALRSSTVAGKMGPSHHEEDSNEVFIAASEDSVWDPTHADMPLTFADMTEIATDFKKSVTAAIIDLKTNLKLMSKQMAAQEKAGRKRDKAITRLESITEKHSKHLINMNRHLEDLCNRT